MYQVLSKWHPEIRRNCPDTPILLVGTKQDLRDNEDTQEYLKSQGLSFLRSEQGQNMAAKIKAVDYVECSALTQFGVREVFNEMIAAVLRPKPPKDTSKCVIS